MSGHTPGPWTVETPIYDRDLVKWGIAALDQPKLQTVALVMTRPDEDANARLIAAAPDLLEALQGLLPEGWGDDDTMDHMPGVKAARLAIAKATGVQS